MNFKKYLEKNKIALSITLLVNILNEYIFCIIVAWRSFKLIHQFFFRIQVVFRGSRAYFLIVVIVILKFKLRSFIFFITQQLAFSLHINSFARCRLHIFILNVIFIYSYHFHWWKWAYNKISLLFLTFLFSLNISICILFPLLLKFTLSVHFFAFL